MRLDLFLVRLVVFLRVCLLEAKALRLTVFFGLLREACIRLLVLLRLDFLFVDLRFGFLVDFFGLL